MSTSTSRRRPRRSSEEVRSLLIGVARSLFTTRGYEATTTREISLQADVDEKVLFSNFDGKAGLFEAAIAQPFRDFVADYVESWEDGVPGASPEQRLTVFVDRLYDLARDNRVILHSAIHERIAGRPGPGDVLLDTLAEALQSIGRITALQEDYRNLDGPSLIAAASGMVFGVALLDDLLFPRGRRRPGRRRLTSEMTKSLVFGINRPQGPTNDQDR